MGALASHSKLSHLTPWGLRAFCVVALSLARSWAQPRPVAPPPASVIPVSATALQVTVSSAPDHTPAMRYAVDVDDDGNALAFDTIKFLLRNGFLDSQPAWLRLDAERSLLIQMPDLRVNTIYRFKVRSRRGEGGPISDYSPVTNVSTLALTPPPPLVRRVGPDKLRIKVQPGSNPDTTTFAIQAIVEVEGAPYFLNISSGGPRPTAMLVAVNEEWHTLSEWGGTTGVVNIRLTEGIAHQYQVKARNGDLRQTALSGAVQGIPQLDSALAVWFPEDAAHQRNGWTREATAQFLAEGAVSYHFRFDQIRGEDSRPLSSSDPSWADGLIPQEVRFTREGIWYLHLQGYRDTDRQTPFRFPDHFPLGFDTIPPPIARLVAHGLVSPTDFVELSSGVPTTLTTVRFQWMLPPGECLTGQSGDGCRPEISPIRGFTTSFDRSATAEPPSDLTQLITNPERQVTVQQEPATFYFRVRALDLAGNWGPPSAPFLYRVTTRQTPPTAEITVTGRPFHREVQRVQGKAVWVLGTPVTEQPLIRFSEVMDQQSVKLPGAITLSAVRNNTGGEVNLPLLSAVACPGGQTCRVTPPRPFNAGWTYALHVSRTPRSVSGLPLQAVVTTLFTTPPDPQQPYRLLSLDDPIAPQLQLPSNAIGQPYVIVFSADPIQAPVAIRDQQLFLTATQSLLKTLGPSARLVTFGEFHAITPQGDPLPQQRLQIPAQVVFPSSQRTAALAGSFSATRPGRHGVYFFDPSGVWLKVSAQSEPQTSALTAPVTQLGVYGLFLVPDMDLSRAIAFPVPFKPSEGHQRITFANLSTEATIKIYTIAGELVRELSVPSGEGILFWDVTNDRGEPLGSDVFLYVIENSEQRKIGKLMVIR